MKNTLNLKYLPIILTAVLALTACGGDKTADASQDNVKQRQSMMQDWRGAGDIMKGMLENPTSFDKATFQEQAQSIQKNTAQMWGYFSDANAKGDAQDAVWTDAQGFQTQKDNFDKALTDLIATINTAQSADDVQSAFGAMSEQCGACHKVYKK